MRRFEAVPMEHHPDQFEIVEVGAPINPRTGRRNVVAYARNAMDRDNKLYDWNDRASRAPCVGAMSQWPGASPDLAAAPLADSGAYAIVFMSGCRAESVRQDAVADFLAYWGTVPGLVLTGPACPRCGGEKVPGTFCHGDDQCTHGPGGTPDEWCAGWGTYCCRCGEDYARGQL